MTRLEAIKMLRDIADAIENMSGPGWDRKMETEFPAMLGVLQMYKITKMIRIFQRMSKIKDKAIA
jgi:hypothetical protein